jgi:hypothetical protein
MADPGDTVDPVDAHGLVDALERVTPEVGRHEQSGHVGEGLIARDDRAGRRECLEAGRDVRGRSERDLLAARAAADLADDDGAAMDADPDARPRSEPDRPVPLERGSDVERRSQCPLDVVFGGGRVAEVRQDAVAQVLRDVPLHALDAFDAGVLVARDDFAQALGVEAVRQLRRADEVAKDDGQLSPLAVGRRADVAERRPALHAEARGGWG